MRREGQHPDAGKLAFQFPPPLDVAMDIATFNRIQSDSSRGGTLVANLFSRPA